MYLKFGKFENFCMNYFKLVKNKWQKLYHNLLSFIFHFSIFHFFLIVKILKIKNVNISEKKSVFLFQNFVRRLFSVLILTYCRLLIYEFKYCILCISIYTLFIFIIQSYITRSIWSQIRNATLSTIRENTGCAKKCCLTKYIRNSLRLL